MSIEYINQIEAIGVKVLDVFKGAAKPHSLQCISCDHIWISPLSPRLRTFNLTGSNGCPSCRSNKRDSKYDAGRADILDKIKSLNIEILDKSFNGQYLTGQKISIKNLQCGHVYSIPSTSLVRGRVSCPDCHNIIKVNRLQAYNQQQHECYILTATEKELYTKQVTTLTKYNYKTNKTIINPDNLQLSKPGGDGYYIDHIISVKYCLDNNIPVDICAHVSNLRLSKWGVLNNSLNITNTPLIMLQYLTENTLYQLFIDRILQEIDTPCEFNITNNVGGVFTVYFTDYKIAINLCLFEHNCEQSLKEKHYNKKTYIDARDSDIRVYFIFQDEWYFKPDLIINKIKHLLHISNEVRIHARKCSVQAISSKQKSIFLNANHLQSNDKSVINIGAFFEGSLIAVMTFCKPRILMSNKKTDDIGVYELSRFATDVQYKIPGISSKILKYFETHYEYTSIFSYADLRWSDGNMYKQLGFTYTHTTPPAYHYVKGGIRFHRWGFRKDALRDKFTDFDVTLTEYQNMLNFGYDRVWDCGIIKYIKYKNN